MNEETSFEDARKLILTYGWNSTSYQIINPGILHWFNEKRNSLIGFVLSNRVRVVVGDREKVR
jgi:phosphatidylglycerol lysyltransferase